MEKKYDTSTNWAPWLGISFLLSTIFFGIVSNGWVLIVLLFLSFLPSLIVALTLRGYFIIENNQLKYFYKRRKERKARFVINMMDIKEIRRVGKSVFINYGNENQFIRRVHDSENLVKDILQRNSNIKLIEQ
jgi:hypothetical protein